MRKTLKRTGVLYLLILLFIGGIAFFMYSLVTEGGEWAANRANAHLYKNGTVSTAGSILDRNGVVLVESKDGKRVYNSSEKIRRSTLHVVGDTSGFISTGTQTLYRSRLSGYDFVDGIYSMLHGGKDASITLNIDAEANKVAYDAFGDYNGAVIVYNYKTGEMLCSVSKPTYDVNNVPSNLRTAEKYEGVFLDKVISGLYTPGSTMKIVTAISALQNIPDIEQQEWECDGEYEVKDGSIICFGVHDTVDFESALNNSCNCAFADITLQLGASKLQQTANSLGFNKSLTSDKVRFAKSRISLKDDSKNELGWAGIGQSTTLVNPAHLATIVGAIANGGKGLVPARVKSYTTFFGPVSPIVNTGVTVDPAIAARMKELMRSNVINRYGEKHFPNLEFCAKTGTAELDNAPSHSWLAGFSAREDLPLVCVCIAENGGFGSGPATEITNAVMQYFLENYT